MSSETNTVGDNSISITLTVGRLAEQLGERIASRRSALSLSRQQLSDILHVTPTELEQFERGTVRITALQLFDLAQALGVQIAFFYADPQMGAVADPAFHRYPELADDARPRSQSSDLISTFRRIQDTAVRSCILDFVRSLVPREPAVTAFDQDNEPKPDPDRESRFVELARVAQPGSNRELLPSHS